MANLILFVALNLESKLLKFSNFDFVVIDYNFVF